MMFSIKQWKLRKSNYPKLKINLKTKIYIVLNIIITLAFFSLYLWNNYMTFIRNVEVRVQESSIPSYFSLFIKHSPYLISLILLNTIIIILILKVFTHDTYSLLVKLAKRIVQNPTTAEQELRHPVFKPFENYFNSFQQKWQQAEQGYHSIERSHWISEMSAAISHEVRNPLTTVRGFLQLFQKKDYLSNDDKDILELMIQELDLSTALIKDFLDVTRPSTKSKSNIDIIDCLQRIVRVMEVQAIGQEKKLLLTLDDKKYGNPFLQGNQQSFRQIFINLIQNGLQALSQGGTVNINVQMPSTNQVKINIIDNGSGMDENTLNNIGKPFFTTKETGTGLGLPMCFHLVEQMSGKLEISSEIHQGTIATLYFPVNYNEDRKKT